MLFLILYLVLIDIVSNVFVHINEIQMLNAKTLKFGMN